MKVSENFKQVGIVKLDSKNRITLGALIKKFSILINNPIDDFETYIGDNGDILLKPRTAIPTMELWVHQNPDILNDINRGIKDINDGKTTKVKDIENFLDNL